MLMQCTLASLSSLWDSLGRAILRLPVWPVILAEVFQTPGSSMTTPQVLTQSLIQDLLFMLTTVFHIGCDAQAVQRDKNAVVE